MKKQKDDSADRVAHDPLDPDEMIKRAIEGQKIILQDMLRAGVPITYRDDNGALVREMPNGQIEIIIEPSPCKANQN